MVRYTSLTKTKLVALLMGTFQKLKDKLLFHDFIKSCKKVIYMVYEYRTYRYIKILSFLRIS